MEYWQAYYQDGKREVDCVIENRYKEYTAEQPLKMCMEDVTFWGTGFDDWELSETEDERVIDSIQKRFSMIKYGSQENGYHYRLQLYRLQIKIPAIVFSLREQREIAAEWEIFLENKPYEEKQGALYKLDGETITLNETACEKFSLTIEGQCVEAVNPSTFFEVSLQSICKKLAGKYYLCNCFGCLYSDYSPYGQGNIGDLFCFYENKEKYLKVYSKYEGEFTIWDVFEEKYAQCQEVSVCEHFLPRINCLGGYRGKIYGE